MLKILEILPYSDNEDILAAVFTLSIQTPYLFTILYLKFVLLYFIVCKNCWLDTSGKQCRPWSGSTLFVLSEYLEYIQYLILAFIVFVL